MMMFKKMYKENYLHKKKFKKSSITTTTIPLPRFLFLFFALWK